jgi:hypothetical protein
MALTVTEKEHWKNRLGKRIDRKVEAISAEDPTLLERVKTQAKQRSIESLGLAAMQAELDRIEQQSQELDKREHEVKRSMLALVRGEPKENISLHDVYRWDTEVGAAIRRRQTIHEDELLAENEVGRKILSLRVERENLLDTIWLATSPSQVRTLWTKVGELLKDEQTQLQRDAMAIPPIEE